MDRSQEINKPFVPETTESACFRLCICICIIVIIEITVVYNNMTQTSTTTLGQIEPWSNGNEKVLQIPESSRTGVSSLDVFCDIQGTLWWRSYHSVEMLAAYSTAPADWAEMNNPFECE